MSNESTPKKVSLLVTLDMLVDSLPAGHKRVVRLIDEDTRTVHFNSGFFRGQDILIGKIVYQCGWTIEYPTREIFELGV